MDDDKEQYEIICKDRFDRNDKKLDKILYLLQGNGQIGLCERVRNLETIKKIFIWAISIIGGTLLVSLAFPLLRHLISLIEGKP